MKLSDKGPIAPPPVLSKHLQFVFYRIQSWPGVLFYFPLETALIIQSHAEIDLTVSGSNSSARKPSAN